LSTRKEIVAYAKMLTLLPPNEVIIPDSNNGPIEGLELISNRVRVRG